MMVVGCGSVGSEVVRLLAGRISHWTLVDNGCVSVFNPHRQWFGTAEIGTRKVLALRRRLAPAEVLAIDRACDAERLDDFRSVLRRARPHLVVLSAGTSEQGPLARVLWRMGVPHVVAWAYPQARYFEVNVVLPQHGTPCLHCLRSHLAAGPAAPPPVRDELASFLYQELSGADREQAYRDLVAEPATPVDTARLAAVTTACVVEALRPPLDRAPWFRRLLREKTTCLLGGNQVTEIGGRPAYGIQRPGQVIRLGLEDLVRGTGACPGCGRCLPVAAGERAAEANEPNLSSRAADEGLLLASGA
ncbi:MAG: ThiF family adenylyltransferase [Candidatus Schekmanbacteria bacterium]|nr:ThiF family adenylyltransferase [Candidatus Schekmanbacteria bacterium]